VAWHTRRARPHSSLFCTMTTLTRLRLFSAPSLARCQLVAPRPSPFRHRFVPFSSFSYSFRPSFPRRPLQLAFVPSRTISLGSIFSSKPSPTPSPHAVAHVVRIEADANAHPNDVEKQLALFQALSETNIQPGYELIINRWERMSEFVCSFLDAC
jgi:ATP-dependent metalloprotease